MDNKKMQRCICAVLVLLLALTGCGAAAEPDGIGETDSRLHVVTTLFPYYDFTRQIAGDSVDLTMIIPAGMDSHSFEPTPKDIITIQNADILICNGGAMEQWLQKVLESMDTSSMTVVTMMDYVDAVEEEVVEGMEDADIGHSHSHDIEEEEGRDGFELEIEYDEHIWTSPANAIKLVQVIGEMLIKENPGMAERYEVNTKAYVGELERIDQEFRDVVGDAKRNTLVFGDKFPFRYFADEFGLRYWAAFTGCSSDTEPSARTIAFLIDKVRAEGISAVYYLELSSSRVAEIIGEETKARPLLLHSCHNVTRRQFDSGITYLELMEQNVENLRIGLE